MDYKIFITTIFLFKTLSRMSTMDSVAESITIFQWNARSISSNFTRFKNSIDYVKPHIIALQSLKTHKNALPVLDNYYYKPIIDTRYNYKYEQVAIYINKGIEYSPIISPAPNEENKGASSAIKLKLKNGGHINICNVYYPAGCKDIDTSWLKDIPINENWIILGDFNAQHSLWNNRNNNRDQRIADNIIESNLCILNDGSITRIPDSSNHQPSAIDLTLVSPSIELN